MHLCLKAQLGCILIGNLAICFCVLSLVRASTQLCDGAVVARLRPITSVHYAGRNYVKLDNVLSLCITLFVHVLGLTRNRSAPHVIIDGNKKPKPPHH